MAMNQLDAAIPTPGNRYSLWQLYSSDDTETYLIRERDEYGEYPNIFAKVYTGTSEQPTAIILIDTGTGLDTSKSSCRDHKHDIPASGQPSAVPGAITVADLLEQTINANHVAPYTVVLSHCHYDHIGGLQHLFESAKHVKVFASSHSVDYITPYRVLQKNSLCEHLGLQAPKYDASFLDDGQILTYESLKDENANRTVKRHPSSLLVLHTPGHTPDSLSVYDRDSRCLFVGDLFYERESSTTRSGSRGQWNSEPSQPVIFTDNSNIKDWSNSMHRLLDFVRKENLAFADQTTTYLQDGRGTRSLVSETPVEIDWSQIDAAKCERVTLFAAHVTVNVDAEVALLDMLDFMLRIQLDQVPKKTVADRHSDQRLWLWEDGFQKSRFSVRSPWSVIHPSIAEPSSVGSRKSQLQRVSSPFLRSMMTSQSRSTTSSMLKALPLSQVAQDSAMGRHVREEQRQTRHASS